MFNHQEERVITKGIDTKEPKEIQVVCWKLVDDLSERIEK